MPTTLPPLTLQTALRSWTFSLPVTLAVVVLGTLYWLALARLRRQGRSWPAGRAFAFLVLGLGSWVIATMSFLGAYAHVLFWVYATQLVTLLMVTPSLLALGAPLTLAEMSTSEATAQRIRAWPRTWLGRLTTYPMVGTLLIAAVPFVVYFTPLFEYVMRHGYAYALAQLVFVAVGFLFFWPLLSSDDVKRWPWPVATLIVFLETTFDSVPGIAIWLSTRLIAPSYYEEVHRTWGRSLLSDQKLGGLMLWAVGEVVGLPLLIMMVAQWMRADEREAAIVDRELDEAAGVVPEAIGSPDGPPSPARESEPLVDLPWWVKDPESLRRGKKYDWE